MSSSFQTIGIIARLEKPGVPETLKNLVDFLKKHQLNILLEKDSVSRKALVKQADLIITIGGDGCLLSTARIAAPQKTPVLGINRGRFGFLTDIRPNELEAQLEAILSGRFIEEKRFMLQTQLSGKQGNHKNLALNDVTITAENRTHMLSFEIYVDDKLLCSQQSDGVIIATPTGSTAYALSAGGPIVQPHLDALLIVPMSPHTLSMRPIVLDSNSNIAIKIPDRQAQVTCDGQDYLPAEPNTHIKVCKSSEPLRLIHPKGYDYFESLRGKLHWGQELRNKEQ